MMTEQREVYNYKRDSRRTQTQDTYTPKGMDACQTPPYALGPLLPYLEPFRTVWEPATGEGILAGALREVGFYVAETDLLQGVNFFDFEPHIYGCIVTNPPYSIKLKWLARCYELGKPFALLVPVETIGTKTAQGLFEQHGVELLLLDKRVNFKMPNLGWGKGKHRSSAQFPVLWLCWKLLPEPITYGHIER